MPLVPLQYERAVLAGAAVREKLCSTVAARGRPYDVVAHQQPAMPEQLLAPSATGLELDDHESELVQQEAVDLSALRVLRECRTDGIHCTEWSPPAGSGRHRAGVRDIDGTMLALTRTRSTEQSPTVVPQPATATRTALCTPPSKTT